MIKIRKGQAPRRGLSDWLDWMGLIHAGAKSKLERYIGYHESYAESHKVLDEDHDFQEEVRNVAKALSIAIKGIRKANLTTPDSTLRAPRPK